MYIYGSKDRSIIINLIEKYGLGKVLITLAAEAEFINPGIAKDLKDIWLKWEDKKN